MPETLGRRVHCHCPPGTVREKQKGVLKILLAFPYPRSTGHEKECNTDWDRILEVNSEDRENTVYIG